MPGTPAHASEIRRLALLTQERTRPRQPVRDSRGRNRARETKPEIIGPDRRVNSRSTKNEQKKYKKARR